jgi:hypothetical protein
MASLMDEDQNGKHDDEYEDGEKHGKGRRF